MFKYSLFHLFMILTASSDTRISRFVMDSRFQSIISEVPIALVISILEAVYSFFFLTKYPLPATMFSFFSNGSLLPICSIFSLMVASSGAYALHLSCSDFAYARLHWRQHVAVGREQSPFASGSGSWASLADCVSSTQASTASRLPSRDQRFRLRCRSPSSGLSGNV